MKIEKSNIKSNKKIISIISIITIITCFITIYNIKNPVIKGLDGYREIIKYKGQEAETDDFYDDFTEAEYLGLTEDRDFKVYGYKNDSKYNLFTLVGSDNTNTYKTKSFIIPKSGNVTKVFINPAVRGSENKVISKQSDIEMFKKLICYQKEGQIYHIENIFTDGTEIYFAYNNCPVTTHDNLVGYIAYIDSEWIIVNPKHYLNFNKDYKNDSNEVNLIAYKIIDIELIEWLNKNSTGVAPPSYTQKS